MIREEHLYDYKGFLLINHRFILSLALLVLGMVCVFNNLWLIRTLGLLLFAVWYLTAVQIFNFVSINDKFLVIKNHIRIWSPSIYCFTDIRRIVIERDNNNPVLIRVTTLDYKTKSYSCSTLSEQTWHELGKDIEKDKPQAMNLEKLSG